MYPDYILEILKNRDLDLVPEELTPEQVAGQVLDWYYGNGNGGRILGILRDCGVLSEEDFTAKVAKVFGAQVTSGTLDSVEHLAHATGDGCAYINLADLQEAVENGETVPDEILEPAKTAEKAGCGDLYLYL